MDYEHIGSRAKLTEALRASLTLHETRCVHNDVYEHIGSRAKLTEALRASLTLHDTRCVHNP